MQPFAEHSGGLANLDEVLEGDRDSKDDEELGLEVISDVGAVDVTSEVSELARCRQLGF